MDNTKILEEIGDAIAKAHIELEEFGQSQGEDADVDNADKIEHALYLLRQAEDAVDEIVP